MAPREVLLLRFRAGARRVACFAAISAAILFAGSVATFAEGALESGFLELRDALLDFSNERVFESFPLSREFRFQLLQRRQIHSGRLRFRLRFSHCLLLEKRLDYLVVAA